MWLLTDDGRSLNADRLLGFKVIEDGNAFALVAFANDGEDFIVFRGAPELVDAVHRSILNTHGSPGVVDVETLARTLMR